MAGGFKLARGRGTSTAHASLAVCFVITVVIVLMGKAEAPLFDSARAKMSDWTAPVLEDVRAPLVAFQEWVGNIGTFFSVYSENIRLKRENAELRKWQDAALSLEQRVKRYELLVNAVPNPEFNSVAARVIGQSSQPFIKTMLLNAGKNESVKAGQAVLSERGMLGRIYIAGERSSWVILLSDLNSRVPVIVESSNRRAILAGDNTPAPHLDLDFGEGEVKAGDRVLSSGDGGLLPLDLPIGQVVADGGSYRVALFADPDVADFVHILDYTAPLAPPANSAADILPAQVPVSTEQTPAATAPIAPEPAHAAAAAANTASASVMPPSEAAPGKKPERVPQALTIPTSSQSADEEEDVHVAD